MTAEGELLAGSSLGHVPNGAAWEFDEGVTECFEDMLRRSIPQYDVMRETVTALALRHARAAPHTTVVDLGSSRGDALAPLLKELGAYNRYVAVEVSEPMLQVLRSRFRGWVENGFMDVASTDLRTDFPAVTASVVMAVLTLQFVPIEYRQQVVRRVREHLAPGGCFIMVEKVLGNTAGIDALMVDEYLAMKARNGYSADEIERKRFSLEGVLVPLTAQWNEDLLRRCGFEEVDCFWRWMNFAGWLAVR